MELRWDSVTVDVTDPAGNPLRILKGISGVACPGEVVALLGPSGAGKTTLLAALAGRTRISGGAVTVDGIAKHKGEGAATAAERRKMPKQSVAFVTQEDTLLTQLTVFETLWYASAVRLPAHYSQEERLARVHDVIKRLGLAKVAHTQVGTVMSRGLSGGERKRLNVAQELLTDPPVLLADEPTSGLDHVAALSLVDVLADIAAAGRTVVATVHQPSSRLFRRFTTCCVLAEGRLVYFGPASAIATYMESPPVSRPCPAHYNIADHTLEVVQAIDPTDLGAAWEAAPKTSGGTYDVAAHVRALGADVDEGSVAALDAAKTGAQDSGDKQASRAEAALSAGAAGAEGDADAAETAEPGPADSASARGSPSAPAVVVGVVDPRDEPALGVPVKPLPRTSTASSASSDDDVVVGVSAAVRKAEAALANTRPASAAPPACMRSWGSDPRWPTSWCQQFFALTARALRTSKGSTLTWLMLAQHMCITLVASIIWWQLRQGAGAIQDRLGILFFFVIYTGFTSLFGALTTFPAERSVLRRERQSGAYRLSAYYFAKCAADIPVSCVFPTLIACIVYWTVGLRADAGAFFGYIGTILLVSQVAQSLGVLVSASVLDFQRSITVSSVLMLGFMLTSGFYSTEIPAVLSWIKYIGFPTYGYSLMVFNEFPADALYQCGSANDGFSGYPCPVSGAQVHDAILPPFATSGPAVGVLAGMYVFYRALGYVALRSNA
ncbi:hypothetical protein FNF29_01939 [Cafeteria roenbergensis]|uniref:ABC transporter domain-containing protein n=1 Tax=Cafeteria roenbergensis TaxID=33653 RepID=A0A5A8CR37_CAFRO|nr:hypothetical protein FNF29_01939 [Cafeteria roenbergensis]|eukprot:KAA0155188.1 hypothetical protein FNF29_01939 [Cafeteria roenbergensis]